MNTAITGLSIPQIQLPLEQQIECKRESTKISKTRQVFNFGKDVTIVVGAIFGTLLVVNYVGESMRGLGSNVINWASKVDAGSKPSYCFRFANYEKCVDNSVLASQAHDIGAMISHIGYTLESSSASWIEGAIAPFYSAYRASGDVFKKISDLYDNNTDSTGTPGQNEDEINNWTFLKAAQKKVSKAIEDLLNNEKAIYDRISESLMEMATPVFAVIGYERKISSN